MIFTKYFGAWLSELQRERAHMIWFPMVLSSEGCALVTPSILLDRFSVDRYEARGLCRRGCYSGHILKVCFFSARLSSVQRGPTHIKTLRILLSNGSCSHAIVFLDGVLISAVGEMCTGGAQDRV